jgi:hypothetical protein
VSSARQKKQLGFWKELVEAARDAFIQVRIRVAEDDPDRPSELAELRKSLVA